VYEIITPVEISQTSYNTQRIRVFCRRVSGSHILLHTIIIVCLFLFFDYERSERCVGFFIIIIIVVVSSANTVIPVKRETTGQSRTENDPAELSKRSYFLWPPEFNYNEPLTWLIIVFRIYNFPTATIYGYVLFFNVGLFFQKSFVICDFLLYAHNNMNNTCSKLKSCVKRMISNVLWRVLDFFAFR